MNRIQELEATLQAKDATIARLVAAGQKFSAAHSYLHETDEPAEYASVDPQDWGEFDAAIQEATSCNGK